MNDMKMVQHCSEQSQKEKLEQCIICNQNNHEGIHIFEQFICRSCEAEMVNTDVKDQRYPFFIHQMRKLWLKDNA